MRSGIKTFTPIPPKCGNFLCRKKMLLILSKQLHIFILMFFLTKNGWERYIMVEMVDYEKREASIRLLSELVKGRKAGEQQGWASIEDVEAALDNGDA